MEPNECFTCDDKKWQATTISLEPGLECSPTTGHKKGSNMFFLSIYFFLSYKNILHLILIKRKQEKADFWKRKKRWQGSLAFISRAFHANWRLSRNFCLSLMNICFRRLSHLFDFVAKVSSFC